MSNTNPADPKQFADVTSHLRSMARDFGLREEFFEELLREGTDWSFVVKSHALLESAVSTWLASHIGKPALEEVLAEKVEMNARIEMLSALGLGTSAERGMMRALGKLRNKLAHNVHETDFTFAAYLADQGRRKAFAEAFSQWGSDQQGRDFVVKNPRAAIWAGVVQIALHTVGEKVRKMIEQRRTEALTELGAAAAALDDPPRS